MDVGNRYNDSIITFAPRNALGGPVMSVFAHPAFCRLLALLPLARQLQSTHLQRISMAALACSALAACGSFNSGSNRLAGIITPYKIEVVQGNFVAKEQIEALRSGMARGQVRDILGSPLITSAFHADRWDYTFTIRRQGIEAQNRKVTVFFKGDEFDRVEGADALPSEAEFVATLDSGRKLGKVPPLEVSEDVMREFGSKNASSTALSAAAAASSAQAAPKIIAGKVYPPLEGASGAAPANPTNPVNPVRAQP